MIFIPARGLIYIIFHIHQFYPPAWCAGPATDATQRIIGIFPKNFKSITLPGAAPENQKLRGPIREASHLGEDHNADVL